LRGQYGWTAFRELASIWIYVEGLRVAPSELCHTWIRDLAPYIEGTKSLET